MPTIKQRKAINKLVESGGSISGAMRLAGYSAKTAKTPKKLTESNAWNELMGNYLNDEDLAKKHNELLNSTRIDHMVFPLGPKSRAEELDLSKMPKEIETMLDAQQAMAMTTLTDEDIKEMLASVNCTVRRIVHGETARHVYFWSADNKARKEGLDMAYKLKGKYAPEKSVNLNIEVESNETIKELTTKLNALHGGTSITGNGGTTGTVGAEIQD